MVSPPELAIRVYASRSAAGRALAKRLRALELDDPVVLALPRGGVPVGVEVARELGTPIDLVLVRKIGAPHQPEFAIAAVVEGTPPRTVVNPAYADAATRLGDYIHAASRDAVRELERRRRRYLGKRPRATVAGRTAVLVDDGLATGTTMAAAVASVRGRGAARVVVAVPVAPPEAVQDMRQLADDVVCLETRPGFSSVGAYYEDFHQVDDAEVIRLLSMSERGVPTIDVEDS